MRAAVVLCAAVIAVSTSCAKAPRGLLPPVRSSTPAPGDVRSFVKVKMQMEVTGAEEFSFDKQTVIDVHEISGGKNPVAIWFLTVSAGEAVTTDDGRFLSFSADLAPGSYRGPKTYVIDGGGQSTVLGVKTNLGSAAYLAVIPTKKPGPPARYDVLVQPCSLVYTRDARTGSVTCPELGDGSTGRKISWTMRWERL